MPLSLEEYAGAPTAKCLVCSAPEAVRIAVEENEQRPPHGRYSRRVLVAWARDEYDTKISTDSIYKHSRDHV